MMLSEDEYVELLNREILTDENTKLAQEFVERLRNDFALYARTCLTIVTEESEEPQPFIFNEFQKLLHKKVVEVERQGKPVRVIVVKPRRVGCSTYIQGRAMHKWNLSRNRVVRTVAQETDTVNDISGMARFYYDNLPLQIKPKLDKNNPKILSTIGTNCKYRVHTAGTKVAARGGSSQFMHFTEVAYYENPTVIVGAKNIVKYLPQSEVWLESTPNGRNYFYDRYMDAKHPDSDYIAVFFPWFEIPEYSREFDSPEEQERLYDSIYGHRETKQYGDEEAIIKEIKDRFNYDVTLKQLWWRRKCILDNCDKQPEKFNAEYPTDDISCFATSGSTVFPVSIVNTMLETCKQHEGVRGRLKWIYDDNGQQTEKVVFEENAAGMWHFWDHPERGYYNRYIAGVDPAGGTEDGDKHYIKVKDRATNKYIATLNSNCDAPLLLDEIKKAIIYFNNDIHLVIEANSVGKYLIDFVKLEYDNLYIRRGAAKRKNDEREVYGVYTTDSTKGPMVEHGLKIIKDQQTQDYDGEFWKQASTFIKEPNSRGYSYHAIKKGGSGHDRCFDDAVMAFFFCEEGDRYMDEIMPDVSESNARDKKAFEKYHDGESFMSA